MTAMNGIKVLVEGVKINTFESKKGNQLFTFEVIEPVTKFIAYTNNSEKGRLADLAESSACVDLELILKGDRLYFSDASISN